MDHRNCCCVSYVEANGVFLHVWVQDDAESVDTMQSFIRATASTLTPAQKEEVDVPGAILIGQSTDQMHYRVRIIRPSFERERHYRCFFMDYGNVETLPINKLFNLPHQCILSEVPQLCRCCMLDGLVAKNGDTWAENVMGALSSRLLDRNFLIENLGSCGPYPVVRLFDVNNKRDIVGLLANAGIGRRESAYGRWVPYLTPNPRLSSGAKLRACIVDVDSPTDFSAVAVDPTSFGVDIKTIQMAVAAAPKHAPHFPIMPHTLCLVRLDGAMGAVFYRAEVIDVENNSDLTIRLLDIGRKAVVHRTDIFVLTPDLLRYPPLSVHMCLGGLEFSADDHCASPQMEWLQRLSVAQEPVVVTILHSLTPNFYAVAVNDVEPVVTMPLPFRLLPLLGQRPFELLLNRSLASHPFVDPVIPAVVNSSLSSFDSLMVAFLSFLNNHSLACLPPNVVRNGVLCITFGEVFGKSNCRYPLRCVILAPIMGNKMRCMLYEVDTGRQSVRAVDEVYCAPPWAFAHPAFCVPVVAMDIADKGSLLKNVTATKMRGIQREPIATPAGIVVVQEIIMNPTVYDNARVLHPVIEEVIIDDWDVDTTSESTCGNVEERAFSPVLGHELPVIAPENCVQSNFTSSDATNGFNIDFLAGDNGRRTEDALHLSCIAEDETSEIFSEDSTGLVMGIDAVNKQREQMGDVDDEDHCFDEDEDTAGTNMSVVDEEADTELGGNTENDDDTAFTVATLEDVTLTSQLKIVIEDAVNSNCDEYFVVDEIRPEEEMMSEEAAENNVAPTESDQDTISRVSTLEETARISLRGDVASNFQEVCVLGDAVYASDNEEIMIPEEPTESNCQNAPGDSVDRSKETAECTDNWQVNAVDPVAPTDDKADCHFKADQVTVNLVSISEDTTQIEVPLFGGGVAPNVLDDAFDASDNEKTMPSPIVLDSDPAATVSDADGGKSVCENFEQAVQDSSNSLTVDGRIVFETQHSVSPQALGLNVEGNQMLSPNCPVTLLVTPASRLNSINAAADCTSSIDIQNAVLNTNYDDTYEADVVDVVVTVSEDDASSLNEKCDLTYEATESEDPTNKGKDDDVAVISVEVPIETTTCTLSTCQRHTFETQNSVSPHLLSTGAKENEWLSPSCPLSICVNPPTRLNSIVDPPESGDSLQVHDNVCFTADNDAVTKNMNGKTQLAGATADNAFEQASNERLDEPLGTSSLNPTDFINEGEQIQVHTGNEKLSGEDNKVASWSDDLESAEPVVLITTNAGDWVSEIADECSGINEAVLEHVADEADSNNTNTAESIELFTVNEAVNELISYSKHIRIDESDIAQTTERKNEIDSTTIVTDTTASVDQIDEEGHQQNNSKTTYDYPPAVPIGFNLFSILHCPKDMLSSKVFWATLSGDSFYTLRKSFIDSTLAKQVDRLELQSSVSMEDVTVGFGCLLLDHDVYYRVEVIEIVDAENGVFKVLYVDRGDTACCGIADIRLCPPEVMNIPRLAILCRSNSQELLQNLNIQGKNMAAVHWYDEENHCNVVSVCQPSINDLPRMEIEVPEEAERPFQISHVDAGNRCFVIDPLYKSGCYVEMMQRLQQDAPSTVKIEDSEAAVMAQKSSSLVLALDSDGMWKRAILLASEASFLALVQFIDVGSTSKVNCISHFMLPYLFSLLPRAFSVRFSNACEIPTPDCVGQSVLLKLESTEETKTKLQTGLIAECCDEKFFKQEVKPLKHVTPSLPPYSFDFTESMHHVIVTHFESLEDDLFVQFERDLPAVDDILELLNLLNNSADGRNSFQLVEDIYVGKICAARFPDDDSPESLMYRCEVISLDPVTVFYVDYGNTEEAVRLFEIPVDDTTAPLWSKPGHAHRCRLNPVPTDKQEQATEMLEEHEARVHLIFHDKIPGEMPVCYQCDVVVPSEEELSHALSGLPRYPNLADGVYSPSHISEDGTIWLQQTDESDVDLIKFETELCEIDESSCLPSLKEFLPGNICIVSSRVSEISTYRGEIIKSDQDTITVLAIDYGPQETFQKTQINSGQVQFFDIQGAVARRVLGMPRFAVPCRLLDERDAFRRLRLNDYPYICYFVHFAQTAGSSALPPFYVDLRPMEERASTTTPGFRSSQAQPLAFTFPPVVASSSFNTQVTKSISGSSGNNSTASSHVLTRESGFVDSVFDGPDSPKQQTPKTKSDFDLFNSGLKEGTTFRGICVYTAKSGEYTSDVAFFHDEARSHELDTLYEALGDMSKMGPINFPDINIGSFIAARYVVDGLWYRGIVLTKPLNRESGPTVFFIDYGNTDKLKSCTPADVRRLPLSMLPETLKPLAIAIKSSSAQAALPTRFQMDEVYNLEIVSSSGYLTGAFAATNFIPVLIAKNVNSSSALSMQSIQSENNDTGKTAGEASGEALTSGQPAKDERRYASLEMRSICKSATFETEDALLKKLRSFGIFRGDVASSKHFQHDSRLLQPSSDNPSQSISDSLHQECSPRPFRTTELPDTMPLDARVIWITDDVFFAQLENNLSGMLFDEIDGLCQSLGKTLSKIEDTKNLSSLLNRACICKWTSGDGRWYRAIIRRIDRTQQQPLFRVFFVDFGNTDTVLIADLILLPEARHSGPHGFSVKGPEEKLALLPACSFSVLKENYTLRVDDIIKIVLDPNATQPYRATSLEVVSPQC